jgi:pyroglutamyl-peptidase
MEARDDRLPRVLVTGFEPFPGAPVNPTEALVARLKDCPPTLPDLGAFAAELLPVDYGRIGQRLSEIGRAFAPDIAIHFGLAARCSGFRLERVARNAMASAKPDNSGTAPEDGPVCVGPPVLPSTLPLDALENALRAAGVPVEWSDDAGGYLCNVAMTLSLARACEGFAPAISGFIHIPLVGEGCPLGVAELDRGVHIIIATTLAGWPEQAGLRIP